MRFFMLYPNQFAIGNKPIGIGSMAAMLKRGGHEFKLFDCTKYNVEVEKGRGAATFNITRLVGEDNLEYMIPRNPERLPTRIDVTYRGLAEVLIKAIDDFKPDVIGLSALTDDYPLGLGLMRQVKSTFSKIPTIAGGIHPTVDPTGVIAEACFDMVCVGEGEYVIMDIAECVDQGRGFEGIANLWVKQPDGSVKKNAVRPYETDLDSFPFSDWSIYSEVAFYKPYWGTVYKHGDFEMSRGCPYKCSYCVNVHLQEIYKGYQYHREKSVPRVIAEIKYAMEHYDIEFLKFWDETFLLMHEKRMEEFRDLYVKEIGLPYITETTGQSITKFSAKILQDTNCQSVSLGMETGDPDLRKGLLHKPTDNSVYLTAFKLLEEHGVKKAAFNMIGLPTESQEAIFRTIGMNRLVGTQDHSVAIFYPYKGTPIRDMMVQQGWMDEDFDLTDLTDYDFNTFTSGNRSVVRFKDMDSRLVNRMQKLFVTYVYWPAKLYPIIDHIKNNDDALADSLLANVRRIIYLKKFGEWPPRTQPAASSTGETIHESSGAEFFDEPEVAEFAQLLVDNWSGAGFDDMIQMLKHIADGTLRPDFDMPVTAHGLEDWLGVGVQDASELKETRDELRAMAKANSAKYATGTIAPITTLQDISSD